MHLSGERGTACKCGKISGSLGGAHPIAGIVGGCELGDSATTGTAGQAGRLIGRSIATPAPGNRWGKSGCGAATHRSYGISSSLEDRKLGGIFVSYRRSDSQGEAGRLFDDLVTHFGEDTVFMDVAAIEAGRDFRKAIEEGVTKCGVLLVMIGPEWLDAKDERGGRRLQDPSDFVRIETASALKRDIPVVPVLVRGAKMPSSEQLPEELKELAYRNCIELTHARWKSDIRLLVEALSHSLPVTLSRGTNVQSSKASASIRPGPRQEEMARPSKLEGERSSRIDPVTLQRVARELALRIGPVADIVVRRAASQCNSLEELRLKVAEEIDSKEDREKFLLEQAAIPSNPLLQPSGAKTPENRPGSVELPLSSEGEGAPSKTFLPATGLPSSNRRKYLLLVGAGAVFLILVLAFVAHFASLREEGPSPAARSLSQDTRAPESVPAKTDAPHLPAETLVKKDKKAEATADHEIKEVSGTLTKRVVLPAEVSMSLLIRPEARPVYPLLARQAHIQGEVVLDADISKAGSVDALRVISGHPLLTSAAVNAVKEWRYKPYTLNGAPVAVNTHITVKFNLSG
jgi:TonB family protein